MTLSMRASTASTAVAPMAARVLIALLGCVAVLAAMPPAHAQVVAASGASGQGDAAVRAEPPSGFLDLLQPQTNYVDIYYGGDKVGATMATFTPNTIRFADPLKVVQMLSDVTDPTTVLAALSGPLDPHAALVCLPGQTEDCGNLTPKTAGVIFDRNTFRADVFVNPALRRVAKPEASRYLVPTESGPGLVSSLSGIVSGGSGDQTSYSVRNDSVLGLGDKRLESTMYVDNAQGLFVDRGVAQFDSGDWRGTAGLFRSAPLDAAPQEKILGVGLTTQLDTRVDLTVAYATPIVVFLAKRSKVDIYVNGRLASSQVYDAGNQTLDTSSLPNGSYDIQIKIQEIGGQTTEETRFFSKNPELPPANTPLYVAQLGALVDDSTTSGNGRSTIGTIEPRPILRLGTLRRVDANLGAFADLMASNNQAMVEFGGVLLDRPTSLRGSLIFTTDRDAGFNIRYSDRRGDLGYGVNMRQIFVGNPTDVVQTDVFDPFTISTTDLSGNFSYSFPQLKLTAGFSGSFVRRGTTKSWSFGPSVGALLWQTGALDFRLRASATQSSSSFLGLVQLVVSYRDGNFSVQSNGGWRQDSANGSGPEGNANLSWLRQWNDGRQAGLGAGMYHQVSRSDVSVNGHYVDPVAAVSGSADRSFGDGSQTTYNGEVDVNLIGNMNGVSVSGFGPSDSAVVVGLDGDVPSDARFAVYVDGGQRGIIRGHQRLPIPLDPYHSYDISIVSKSGQMLDYDLKGQHVTLFPGSVANVTWHVLQIVPVFGRMVYPDGKPVALARIDGAHGSATTDKDGYFQAQINGTPKLDVTPASGRPCHLTIKHINHQAVFLNLGTLVCRP